MDLNAPASDDNLFAVTDTDIFTWASQYLPRPSAEAFTAWLDDHLSDWADDDVTLRRVLTGAYQQWTGGDLPTPDCPHGYRATDTCPMCDPDKENAR